MSSSRRRFRQSLDDVMLVTLLLAGIPVAIFIVGLPFVALGWLVAGFAAG